MSSKNKKSLMSTLTPTEVLDLETPKGTKYTRTSCRAPREKVMHDCGNVRFAPEEPLTPEQHKAMIIAQDEARYANLVESIKKYGVLEPITTVLDPASGKLKVVMGNRRYYAAGDAGIDTLPVYVLSDLPEDELAHLRDWPEAHPTKVPHKAVYIAKIVHDTLKSAPTPDTREARINLLAERYGFGKKQVEKMERVATRLLRFRKDRGEAFDTNPDSFKAFESYDSLQQNELGELRQRAEFDKLETLEKVAESYLEKNIAHDDFREAVAFLAKAPTGDQMYQDITSGRVNIKDEETLRQITRYVREASRRQKDPAQDLRLAIGRAVERVQSDFDAEKAQECILEMQRGLARMEAIVRALGSCQ